MTSIVFATGNERKVQEAGVTLRDYVESSSVGGSRSNVRLSGYSGLLI